MFIAIVFLQAITAVASDTNSATTSSPLGGNLHNYLEIIQTFTNVAIAIFAAIGLRQIVITRRIARMNAKRESFKLAGEQTVFYLTKIIPLQDKLADAIEAQNVTYFKAFKVDFTDKKFKATLIGKKEDLDSFKKIISELADVLNGMEAFSMFFTQGVADEKAAFSAIGETFCFQVRKLSPVLVAAKAGQDSYRNLTELFFLWNERLEARKLTLEQEQISKKLNTIGLGKMDTLGTDI
jgi:hypothetical protein